MLISDIHLRDYHKYNKTLHERLNSFIKLAELLRDEGKQRDINTLLVGGDLIDKNTLSPIELHVLFKMFSILAQQFRIYSIIGNHDAKSKKEISINDTAITLLEEIDGITFHNQEILEIGGRKIALENWRKEYDLSWIKSPVDLYMSHATIDYDETGLYGMDDLSVFDNKFTLGVFGDIHVTRQLNNLVSIGNTKQESLNDKYQGGFMIMDLDDLSYERIPIDPEHKIFLHLERTEIEEEEGWEDFEGESMVYKIYSPKKVGTTTVFTIPEITDIEDRTTSVMKTEGLSTLHSDISESCNHESVDFNFNITSLLIENFRSVEKYTWDLTSDYIITGANGSGKSSLITGLFYALVGKKGLRSDITFGKDYCKLEVSLTYRGQEFTILRGTKTGQYGLSIDGTWLKYNTKAEFEKDVYSYLPFLNYHQSFFFNYWDTELLGTLKVDKRYDLLSKYYKLDILSSYHDVALDMLKTNKKELKTIGSDIISMKGIATSREVDIEEIKDKVKDHDSKEDVEKLLTYHLELLNLSDKILSIRGTILSKTERASDYESSISSQLLILNSLKSNIDIDIENVNAIEVKKSLKDLVDAYLEYKTVKSNIGIGESDLKVLRKDLELSVERLEDINNKIKSLKNLGELQKYPEGLEESIYNISNKIDSLKKSMTVTEMTITSEISNIKENIKVLNKELKDLELSIKEHAESHSEDLTCDACGQDIDYDKLYLTKKSRLKNLEDSLLKKELLLSDFEKSKIPLLQEIESLVSEKKEFEAKKSSIDYHNDKIEGDAEILSSHEEKRNILNDLIFSKKQDIEKSVDRLELLSSELSNIKEVSEEDYLSANTSLINLNLIIEAKDRLQELRITLKPKIQELTSDIQLLNSELESLKDKLSNSDDVKSPEELNSLREVISSFDLITSYEDKLESIMRGLKQREKEFDSKESVVSDLDKYCLLTSRSGAIIKNILEDLTKTFTSDTFRFTTARVQANGKVVADMSMEYLVGNRWVPYSSLSSGQRTLCDLYYLSKVITGVGIVSFDETLRFLDDENIMLAATLIDSIKKNGILISSHSSNLSMEGTKGLNCVLLPSGRTDVIVVP